jgi:hypothetical protein
MPKRYTQRLAALAALSLVLTALSLVAGELRPDPLPAFDPDTLLTAEDRAARFKQIQPGLSPDQVRRLIGPPQRSARQILYHRAREQWLYDVPFSVRLEFEYVRGQEPHLLSVQPTAAAKP